MTESNKEEPLNVQANNDSIAVGKIEVGGSVSGNIVIGGELHVHNHDSQDARKESIFEEFSPEDFEPETVLIPEGPVHLPDSEKEGIPLHENPQQEFILKAYRIGKGLVTNSQYEEFVQKTGRPTTTAMGWLGRKVPEGFDDRPVMGITWYDALDYCKWLGGLTKRNYSLPSFAQLEKGYQMGGECENGEDDVRQWTCTLWGEKQRSPDVKYRFPWKEDGRNKLNANSQILRVVCFYRKIAETGLFKLESRVGRYPDDTGLPGERHGFRVVIIR